jgi:Sulfotransferase family
VKTFVSVRVVYGYRVWVKKLNDRKNMKASSIELSATELLSRAREVTGIHHINDFAIEKPLTRLIHSLNTETVMHPEGAQAMASRLLRMLSNRLRMERDFLDHPEIEAQEVTRPVFITGMGRTGSTKLQRMLSASNDFLYLPCWQSHSLSLRTGDRLEDPTPRIRDAESEIHWFNSHAPNVEAIHPFAVDVADEESVALEHCLFAPWIAALAFVPSYAMWRVNQGFEADLRYLKRILQYIQWQFHDGDKRTWILKSPAYPGLEPVLKQVFPDAVFLTTHRNPVKVVSSAASLLSSFHGAWSNYDPREILGPMVLEQLASGADMHMIGRDRHQELNILDVGYSELTRNAMDTMERVYKHCGLPLEKTARDNMDRWEQENQQHKHGVHTYSLLDYHLSEAAITERFADYIRRFEAIF